MAETAIRVLHLGKFFPPHPGGIERFVADLAKAQSATGLSVRVLAHAEPGTHRSRHLQTGDVEVDLAACHGQFVYAPVSPAFPRLLARAIGEFKPDVLHMHVPNTSAFWALLSPTARRIPWIVHWHADIPLDTRRRMLRLAYGLYKPWERALLRRARAVIATSTAYADSSAALAPWRDKVRTIPLGLPDREPPDAATSTNIQWPAPGLRLLAVGRLSYFKGFDVLLRALARVPDASLVLIGDGECGTTLRLHATELGIANRVRFVGRLNMDEAGQTMLDAAYADADVLCLPSTERAESFGLVLLEAMRAGKPVIASNIPGSGVGFVVRDGRTGLLATPRDTDALAAAIGKLQCDSALRETLGTNARHRFQNEFTLERVVPQLTDRYRRILADGTTSPAA